MIKITIILIVFLILPHYVFAQEYLTVKPTFLKDHSDACSIMHDNKVPNYDITAFPIKYVSNHASNNLNSNYTRTTIVYYNDTKIIVTLIPNISKNDGNIYGTEEAPYIPHIYASDSAELTVQTLKKIRLEFGEYTNFTLALTNVGNKTVEITHPFTDVLGVITNFENGTSVQNTRIDQMQLTTMLEMPSFNTYKLKPGQSLVQYYDPFSDHLINPLSYPLHYMVPAPGNYTVASFTRFLGDVNGTCTMVYLWSQPVNLIVLPEGENTNKEIPEFPFAIPILLVSITSLILLYRIKFR